MFRLIYWPLKRLQLQFREFAKWRNLRPHVTRRLIKDPANSPVFVFSASWRTGSTLLQRIICASNRVFIWGEPHYLDNLLVLYRRMNEIQQYRAHGTQQYYARRSWIPVLSPGREIELSAFRSFFKELYFAPIKARGYSRWGFKEVRSNAVEIAKMLYDIFPEARFIFLVRNPLDTYLSIKNTPPIFESFTDPFRPVHGWVKNTGDFLNVMSDSSLPAILIRYEDLTGEEPAARESIAAICSHLSVPFNYSMFRELKAVIGSADDKEPLTANEREKVVSETREIASRIGYQIP